MIFFFFKYSEYEHFEHLVYSNVYLKCIFAVWYGQREEYTEKQVLKILKASQLCMPLKMAIEPMHDYLCVVKKYCLLILLYNQML